jgi:hypothetical protein
MRGDGREGFAGFMLSFTRPFSNKGKAIGLSGQARGLHVPHCA